MAARLRRIVITLPARIVKDVDWLAPLEDMTRDELISEALKRFLKPHLEIRAQVLKAASKPRQDPWVRLTPTRSLSPHCARRLRSWA